MGEPDGREVDEAEDARLRPRHDVLAEPGEVRASRAPGVAQGRHPRRPADGIRLHPEVVSGDEGVGVEIDQPRPHVAPGDIDGLAGVPGREGRLDRRDAAGGERHVPPAIDAGGGVDHVAAGED